MIQMRRTVLSLALLLAATTAFGDCNTNNNNSGVANVFVTRSQGRDKTIQAIGSVGHTHLCDVGCTYGTFAVIPEYTRSFRPSAITDCLFGPFVTNTSSVGTTKNCDSDCSSSTLLIQGSSVAGRSSNALVADNFYLPPDFSSQVSFRPRISNALVNFDFYVGLDNWLCGLYFRAYGPYVHTRWNLGFCENVITTGTNGYPAGVFTETNLPNSALLTRFTDYIAGKAPVPTNGNGFVSGDAFTVPPSTATYALSGTSGCGATIFGGLQNARIFPCSNTANGFADLRFELGWDFWCCDDYHIGVNAQMAFPTGRLFNASSACLLFAPRIGDRAWELGVGLTGHYVFWRSECEDAHFGIYLDANVNHLFRHSENRVFDLKGKPLSRYMLAERFATNTTGLVGNVAPSPTGAVPPLAPAGGFNSINFVFANEFAPVANLTNRNVRVSVGAEADIVVWFNLTYCNFSWDVGYDFWARSREKFNHCSADNCSFAFNTTDHAWGLKGNARVIGFASVNLVTPGVGVAQPPHRLSATQSTATINCVISNRSATGTGIDAVDTCNTGIDNPQQAYFIPAATGALTCLNPAVAVSGVGLTNGASLINTSVQPVLLTEDNLDYVRMKGLTHKVFTHLQYNFDCECWTPYLGIGGFGEFGRHRRNCDTAALNCNTTSNTTTNNSNSNCDSSHRCSLSQWGVFVKGGVSFN